MRGTSPRALLAAAPPPVETVPAGGTPTAPFVTPAGSETAPAAPGGSSGAAGAETAPVGTRHVASTSAGTQRIPAPAPKSKKWLWAAVAAAAIAIGAAAYFLASYGKSSPEEPTDPIAQPDTTVVAEPGEPTHSGGLSEVAEGPTTEPDEPELVQQQAPAQPAQPEPVQPIDHQQTQPPLAAPPAPPVPKPRR